MNCVDLSKSALAAAASKALRMAARSKFDSTSQAEQHPDDSRRRRPHPSLHRTRHGKMARRRIDLANTCGPSLAGASLAGASVSA